MSSIFSRIVRQEIPCYKLAENDQYLAFLDINPLKSGHALVIPKREEDYIFNLSDEELCRLILFAKKVGRAIEASVNCKRIGLTVIGLEVPHTHIHLIPIDGIHDMNFSNAKLHPTKEEFLELADRISLAFKQQNS